MTAKKLVSTALLLGMFATPLPTQGREMTQLQDTVAGVGTQVHVRQLEANERIDVLVLPPVGDEIVIPVQADANGEAVADVHGDETERAGVYTVSLGRDGDRFAERSTFEVFPDSIDRRSSRIVADRDSINPNGRDVVSVTVIARDRYDNPIVGHPLTLVSNRADDWIDAVDQQTDERGEQRFDVATDEAGSITLRALDLISGEPLEDVVYLDAGGGVGGERIVDYDDRSYLSTLRAQATPSRNPIIDHFEIDAPSKMRAGVEAQEITIRAVDRNDEVVDTYVNTIIISSPTDPLAVLPGLGRYTFEGRDLGERTFSLALKFSAPGKQVLRVEDAADPRIAGQVTIDVSGTSTSGGGNGIEITSHKDGQTVNTDTITLEGRGPAFANLLVMGGLDDVRGDTDRGGLFSIKVRLNPDQREFTLRVRDDAGRNDSGPLRLILDNVPPTISGIAFNPTMPEERTQVQVTAQAEPQLKSMIMEITNPRDGAKQEVTLTETATASGGTYTATFTAPETGNYQPKFIATDAAGNSAQMLSQLLVGMNALPQVQNLKAQSRKLAVSLTWDALQEEVDGYRIYVGETPESFPYVLETGKPMTRTTVSGLEIGKDYYFAVTAVKGDQESIEKSEVVKAQAVGLILTIKPGNAQLDLSWNKLPKEIPIASYRVEYGLSEDAYQIIKEVTATSDSQRDLVNGVTYAVRVTPLTSSGNTIADLAVTGRGTPSGDLHPGAGDPIPFRPTPTPVLQNPTPYVPVQPYVPPAQLPENGLPPIIWWIAGGATALLTLMHWQLRRSQRISQAFLREMQSRYYH